MTKFFSAINLFVMTNGLLVHIIILISFCYFAEKSTNSLINIKISVQNCTWLLYPKTIQIDLMRVIEIADIPVYYTGAGVLYCNFETCSKVCRSAT